MTQVPSATALVAACLLLALVCVSPLPMLAASHGPAAVASTAFAAQPSRPAAGRSDDSAPGRQAPAGAPADPSALLDPRVRPADPSARRLVDEGARRSYTIAKLIDTIERGDVVVYVHVDAPPGGLQTSQTRLLATGSNGWRYASVWIDQRLFPLGRLEMLGHELQHAVEIVEARDVTDGDSLRRLYERIGHTSLHDSAFETRGAIVVQLQVSHELLAGPELADALPDGRASAVASAAEHRKLYDAYCAVCHGRNGRGRGVAFRALDSTPPDLTLLAERNGGAFPRVDVERCIRASVRRPSAAGSGDMPVWTGPFGTEGDLGAAAHAGDIADYVESLQRRTQH